MCMERQTVMHAFASVSALVVWGLKHWQTFALEDQ